MLPCRGFPMVQSAPFLLGQKNIQIQPNRVCVLLRGKPFALSIATLRSSKSNVLSNLSFGGPYYYPITVDEEGRLCLDRDPEAFYFVLRHLTNPQNCDVQAIAKSRCGLAGVIAEAEFFELPDLAKQLRQAMVPKNSRIYLIRAISPDRHLLHIHLPSNHPPSVYDTFEVDVTQLTQHPNPKRQASLFAECMENLSNMVDLETRKHLANRVKEAVDSGHLLMKTVWDKSEFIAVMAAPPVSVS